MKSKRLSRVLMIALATAAFAQASIIFDITSAVSLGNPTQTGRLSRNNIPQDWTGGEPFPGVINTASVYHYTTYLISVGITPFIQIDSDSLSPNTFVSAYLGAYLPNSVVGGNLGFDTNWLGDAGGSGNFFGVDPRFFQ